MKRSTILTVGALTCLLLLSCAGCGAQNGGVGSGVTSEPEQRAAGTAAEAGKPGDTPQASNGYLVAEKVGADVKLDLDGDGKADTLNISVKEVEDGWSFSSLTINGKEFLDTASEDPLNAYKVFLDATDRDRYFITDLDTKDKALEIALLDYGPSDDPVTWYFHYKDGTLQVIGSLPGFPDDSESSRDGSGNVMAVGRLGLLQTWNATFPYNLKEGTLEKVPQSQYIPLQDPEAAVTLKQKLTLYAKPDQKAKTVTVEPSKAMVTFPATDDKNWVQMHTSDGVEGWIYLKDFSTIVSDGQELNASDVFDNLVLAD